MGKDFPKFVTVWLDEKNMTFRSFFELDHCACVAKSVTYIASRKTVCIRQTESKPLTDEMRTPDGLYRELITMLAECEWE